MGVVAGTFTATGDSTAVGPFVPEYISSVDSSAGFNISLWGTFVATITLERCFDGTNWLPRSIGTDTSFYTWTGPISMKAEEPESGVAYRLRCTSYTSGTVQYRLSQ